MSNEHTKPEATDGDRDLAFVRKWIDTDESEGVQRTVLKELRELIATRLAPVEAEVAKWKKLALDPDECREAAEAERDEAVRSIDKTWEFIGPSSEWAETPREDCLPNAVRELRAERDALRATVAKMREALVEANGLLVVNRTGHALPVIVEALSLVPADLSDSVCVKRSEWETLNESFRYASMNHKATLEDLIYVSKEGGDARVRNAALEAENRALREALEGLLDEQNGVPLIRRADEYEAAVAAARKALAPKEGNAP